jgi:hypothetical protein
MHVDRTALGDPGITPHVLEQALPREDLPRVFEKVPEQDELPGRRRALPFRGQQRVLRQGIESLQLGLEDVAVGLRVTDAVAFGSR